MNRDAPDSAPHYLRSIADERLRTLFRGVSEVHLTDFPDYANVGDSVLSLGLLKFFREEGIKVRAVDFVSTMQIDDAVAWARSAPGRAIVSNGGGNLGDLYPHHQAHREAILVAAQSPMVVIQAPQSGHFRSQDGLHRYQRLLSESRAEVRVGVRDGATLAMIPSAVESLLIPDTAHALGKLKAAPSVRRVIRLLRADVERVAGVTGNSRDGVFDWPPDSRITELQMRIERKLARNFADWNLRRGSLRWGAMARRRLAAGCALLAQGDVIITDRLHAMIMGIHMGRRVVYLDNSTHKLWSYADAWFTSSMVDIVRPATSRAEAEEIARQW